MRNSIFKIFSWALLVAISTFIFLPHVTFALDTSTNSQKSSSTASSGGVSGQAGGSVQNATVTPTQIKNPFAGKTLNGVVAQVINILLAIIVIAAVVVIVIAGFRMVLAQGNEGELTKAKKSIIWSLVGILVAVMSFAIVRIIQSIL